MRTGISTALTEGGAGIVASCEHPMTLDIYTQAVSQQKREANAKVVEMMLLGFSTLQHLRKSGRRSGDPVNNWY